MKRLSRSEQQEKYTWKTEDIFENEQQWEALFCSVDKRKDDIVRFKGKLVRPEVILECLRADEALGKDLYRLDVYAHLKKDENVADEKYQALTSRIQNLEVKVSGLSSFIVPEITKLSKTKLTELSKDKRFADFSYFFERLIKRKDHILSESEEKLLSQTHSFAGEFETVFTMLDNADIVFNPVNVNGEEVELSHGIYSLLMQNRDRTVRKNAYHSMFEAYKGMVNTIAANYSAHVKKDWFYAKVRNYGSCLQKALLEEDVEDVVYRNLTKSVSENIKYMHEYVGYRQDQLSLDTIAMYDLHVSLVEGTSLELPYEEACDLVKKALTPLGEDYIELLNTAFTNRWIDVFENKGKKSGAYSCGCYGVHPYVLLNYQKTTHDVFTIAHELGHSLHSYYSNMTQSYEKAGYTIFVAEVASTVNEVLLLKYLIQNTADVGEKKFYLSYFIDMIRTTLFRQTMFAEFEQIAHEEAENDRPLTASRLCAIYKELNDKYYGTDIEDDNLIQYEWARIPHFYSSFYVYKYATGITSAINIANRILETGDAEDYKEFLRSGGSRPPVELLKIAGVDLTSDQPFIIAMREFKDSLDKLKELSK